MNQTLKWKKFNHEKEWHVFLNEREEKNYKINKYEFDLYNVEIKGIKRTLRFKLIKMNYFCVIIKIL